MCDFRFQGSRPFGTISHRVGQAGVFQQGGMQWLDLAGGGLKVESIPSGSINQHLASPMRCIEVVGVIDGTMPSDPKVVCFGLKAPVHDDFHRVVVSAMNRLAAAGQSADS
jgi:hypothetical protein